MSDNELDGEGSEVRSPHRGETRCELVAISKTEARDWTWAKGDLLEWELDEHPSADRIEDAYEFYNVLWIRWRDGVAYRQVIGRVSTEIWDSLELEEVEVKLG